MVWVVAVQLSFGSASGGFTGAVFAGAGGAVFFGGARYADALVGRVIGARNWGCRGVMGLGLGDAAQARVGHVPGIVIARVVSKPAMSQRGCRLSGIAGQRFS
jgi:hypothetical protein